MKKLLTRGALLLATAFAFGTHMAAAADNAPATAPAATHAPSMPIYDTALAPGWDNWSWAKTEVGVGLSGSARKPIKKVVDGLWLQNASGEALPKFYVTEIKLE